MNKILKSNTISLPSFHHHFVGFDDIFNELARINCKPGSYPPYNIIKVDDQRTVLEMACAGFSKEDLSVERKDNLLKISGSLSKKVDETLEYLHRGLSNRNFETEFRLNQNIKVSGVKYENGLLQVELVLEEPEGEKFLIE